MSGDTIREPSWRSKNSRAIDLVRDLRSASSVVIRDPLWTSGIPDGETIIVREYVSSGNEPRYLASAGLHGRNPVGTGDDVRPVLRLVETEDWHSSTDIDNSQSNHEPRALIQALARETPFVVVERPDVPEATGDLVADVRALCGLSVPDLSAATGVGIRAVGFWVTRGPSEQAKPTLEGLRAVGGLLVDSLGPDGVRTWLRAGTPSRLEQVRAGRISRVAAEAREYLDTVFT